MKLFTLPRRRSSCPSPQESNEVIALTPSEFRLLAALVRHAGQHDFEQTVFEL